MKKRFKKFKIEDIIAFMAAVFVICAFFAISATLKNKDVKENKYETDEDYKFIYKCSKCGNEFTSTDYDTPPCDVCHAQGKDVEEVGCEFNGVKYYYEEYEKEIKNDTVKV